MAELKTKQTAESVEDFLNSVEDTSQRADSFTIARMMQEATNAEPKMWGTSIVGFGYLRLKYNNGRELDWFPIGFSPRKGSISLYGLLDSAEHAGLLATLGKHKTGKSCLYIKRLSDVNLTTLRALIDASVA